MSGETISSPVQRQREIFLLALDKTDSSQRAAFLDKACGGNVTLRRNVEELLRDHEAIGDFLEAPAISDTRVGSPFTVASAVSEQPGDRIGRYKLLQMLGEGGCGVVYMAEQEEPVRRRVALKIIKLGMDTRSVIARFEAERQALAMMDHPNIARVFDAGATEKGRLYFVMELVRGVRITEYCDENTLATEQRLALFIQVCQAIQHAHQKGVIHRDIKPSNILVTLHDGVPVPKVIDFGIAKATEQRLTDKTLFTEFHSFIGTPAYMSPEQAGMSGLDIDTRSDIYSLGVLLYEMLTGKTPFDAVELTRMGLDECRRIILQREPPRPSTRILSLSNDERTQTAGQRRTEAPRLVHTLRGDLDWVVMKCLEKDRSRRYESAAAVALDVQRFLDEETVLARPPTTLYQFGKFLKRHRGSVSAAAAVVLALLVGVGLSVWQAVRATKAEHTAASSQKEEARLRLQAERERARAEKEGASARLSEYVADMNLVQQSLAADNYGRALQLLRKHRQKSEGEHDLRGFEWRYLWQLARGDNHVPFPRQQRPVTSIALSPDGQMLAVSGGDGFTVYNIPNHAVLTSQRLGGGSVAFVPNNNQLLSADSRAVHVWSTANWSEIKVLSGNGGPVTVSKSGRRAATLSREGARIWNTGTWEELRLLPDAEPPISLSGDGSMAAAALRSGAGIAVWSLETGESVLLENSSNLFVRFFPRNDRALAFTPDGRSVVIARNMPGEHGVFVLGIWDTRSGKETGVMPQDPDHTEHSGSITSMEFSADGRTLVTASMDYSIRLWNFEKRQRIATLQGNVSEVWSIAFSPDGQSLVSGARDGTVRVWPVPSGPKRDDEFLAGARLPLGMSQDSRTLVALNRVGNLVFFDTATGEAKRELQIENPRQGVRGFRPPPPLAWALALSADLHTLITTRDGRAQVWNTETSESTTLTNSGGHVVSVALSPDATTLITFVREREAGGRGFDGGRPQTLWWWDLRHGTNVVIETEAIRALFSPDGQSVALFSRGNQIEIRDVHSRLQRTNFVVEAQLSQHASFSPDGKILAVVCNDDDVRLFDTASARLIGTLIGHKQTVQTVAFAPGGKTIATGSDDSTLKLWNVDTQQELLTVRRLGGAPRGLLFSPDGRLLVAGSSSTLPGGGLRLFRAPSLEDIDAAEAHEDAEYLQR